MNVSDEVRDLLNKAAAWIDNKADSISPQDVRAVKYANDLIARLTEAASVGAQDERAVATVLRPPKLGKAPWFDAADLEALAALPPGTKLYTHPTQTVGAQVRPVREEWPACFPQSRAYSVEPHGKGYAIYQGRDLHHHGLNLGQLTECSDGLPALIERALNGVVDQENSNEPR